MKSMEIQRGGVEGFQNEAKLEYPGGLGWGIQPKKPFCGRGKDIFWNNTFQNGCNCQSYTLFTLLFSLQHALIKFKLV